MASVTKRDAASGPRYDVRYRTPARQVRTKTFRRKVDADRFAREVETDLARGDWTDPRRGRILFADYAVRWVEEYHHPPLRETTAALYRGVLRRHILPTFGQTELAGITTEAVRNWHTKMTKAQKPGPATVAKAYRLMRSILNAAVDEEKISRNPCRIKGAGNEKTPERPVVELKAVLALADEVKPERRLMVLLAGFCGLRLGEVLGLKRDDVDVLHGVINVHQQLQEHEDGTQALAPPKTAAGVREVVLPEMVADAAKVHLDEHAGADGWLFTGDKGGPLRRHVWNAEWRKARKELGMPAVRFHDLRHTALTTLASHGATTKEVMVQAGHKSHVAALRYQHRAEKRAQELAELMQGAIDATEDDDEEDSGSVRAIFAR